MLGLCFLEVVSRLGAVIARVGAGAVDGLDRIINGSAGVVDRVEQTLLAGAVWLADDQKTVGMNVG